MNGTTPIWKAMKKAGVTPLIARGCLLYIDLNNPVASLTGLRMLQELGHQHECLQVVDRTIKSIEQNGDNVAGRTIKTLHAIRKQLMMIIEEETLT